MRSLAGTLKKLREEKGLKQDTLANEIGCTRYMVSYYENGRAPSLDILQAYCKFFDVSADYLLGLSAERKPVSNNMADGFALLANLAGSDAPTATDTSALVNAAVAYYRSGAPCGSVPMRALVGFMDGLREALTTAAKGDAPAMLDAANAAVVAALDVTKMPALYYDNTKGV